MENENKTQQDCGCGSDCCTLKKSKLWMKIVFIVIIVAVIAIVAVKLSGKTCKSEIKGAAIATEKPICGDSTKSIKCVKICDPEKNPSCCPKAKK